jgi:hypothetical protein
MLYYYLDGLDKKGPYTVDELKARQVSPDTMVFADGMTNWTAIKNLPELSDKIFPVTKIEQIGDTSSPVEPETTLLNSKTTVDSNIKQSKIVIPAVLFLILGIVAAITSSYFITKGEREADLQKMNKKIDEVFQGKDEVCDYTKTGVQGKLKDADWLTPNDNEGNALVEYYECNSGGFTVVTLSKKPNGFDFVKSYSKNMGYKIPASRWSAGKDYGYGIYTPGYSTPTYRQTIQEAYNTAMKYLSSEKENKCYSAGSYDRIQTFDEIKTDYYYIDNVAPTKYSSATNSFKSWNSSDDAMVFNNQCVIWYAYNGKHFEIIENKEVFTKKLIIYSGIGSVLALLLYFLIRYRRRIALQVT